MFNRRPFIAGTGLVLALLDIPTGVLATQRFGPVELSGNLQTTNLVRHPDAETYQYVQNRNVARIRLDYAWLQGGKFLGTYDIPFLQSSTLLVMWRGVYDSVYDTTPGFGPRADIHGHAYGRANRAGTQTIFEFARTPPPNGPGPRRSRLTFAGLTHGERDALKFDNQLREAYADIKFRGLPLSVRAGRQQIVWGETDNNRLLDRVNALDLTWHLQQEIPPPAFGWDELRRPYWMIKFLYDLGGIGEFSQNFLEWYWNPGDWRPAKQAFLPRPWGLPFFDPLTNPVDGSFSSLLCSNAPGQRCTRLVHGTKLFGQGDYSRNPIDNSQVGVRFHSITPFGMEFTLAYFYQRWSTGDDGSNPAPLRGIPATLNAARDNALRDRLTKRGIFPAEAYMPYVHTIGASANYSDDTYTQTVYRFETVYDIGEPFFDLSKVTLAGIPGLPGLGYLPGVTRKNMWKGFIGFDRPTWIRSLNRTNTFFITGQFFWHYLVDNPDCRGVTPKGRRVEGAQNVALLVEGQRAQAPCLVGALDLPSQERQTRFAFRDKIRDWETLATLATYTFYRSGSIVPSLGMAVDPTNQFSMSAFWAVYFVVRNDLTMDLAQRYYITPRGTHTPIFETWGLAGLNRGRSETSLRVTYQF